MASPESIPVIDLRLLSHSDIVELARNDPHAYDLNRLSGVAPKIDRSVFNESAGSRKQTYSRIRKPSPAPRRPSPDRGDRENELIVQFLQHLFEPDKFPPPPDTELALAAPPPPSVRTAAAAVNVVETSRALVVVEDLTDNEVLNAKGEVVDVAGLGAREEPFADELRRTTEGMKTEEELLWFLAGLEGKWESPRNKQKFVDAAGFGDVFPRGWKLLLGLRRKEGVPSLYCRRYISPNGREFVTCKEVASYMVSFVGQQVVKQQTSGQDENGSPGLAKSTPRCIEDGPSGVGQEHGNVTRYEDLRMDVEPPMEFDFMTYQGSLPSSQHEMSYVTQMEDVNDPLLVLDWRLSLPNVVGDGCEFKQCVWCGREFYHDSVSSQLQPNMIGLICPACKENT